jgi:hypothetical protein
MTNPVPKGPEVNKFHTNSDKDVAQTSQHHTLGLGHNQSSPGNHKHNGVDSVLIAKGLVAAFPSVAGATYNQSDFQKVLDLLNALGANA